MRRRDFIKGLAGSATTMWPLRARAQQMPRPVIGFLNGQKAAEYRDFVSAFRQGLSEAGIVEEQNAHIEFRWAEGHRERIRDLQLYCTVPPSANSRASRVYLRKRAAPSHTFNH